VPGRALAALWHRLGAPGWRSLLVTGTLFGTMLVSVAGAWAVRQAWVEHERSVEAALDEYARYAARSFGEQMTADHIVLRHQATAAVAVPADLRPLTLAEFSVAAGAVLDPRLGHGRDPYRGYFRLDLRTRRLETGGAAATAPLLRDSLAVVVDSAIGRLLSGRYQPIVRFARGTGVPLLWYLQSPNGGVAVVTALQRTADGTPVAAFGYTSSRRDIASAIAASTLRRPTMLLPPSTVGDRWLYAREIADDTLVALQVLDADGTELYHTAHRYDSGASGAFVFRGLSTSVTRATLHPALASRLRENFLRTERRRLQLVLPLVAVLLAGAGIVHIRRERELQQARRDFVASVSHDLRTPLAQIRMFSETLLLGREQDEAERLRWLGVIGREARRLGDLVENILLFSHIDAARVRLEPERTDLGELVEEAVEAYVPVAAARRMRIVADAPSRIYAVVDPRALRQVVVNLLDNALKYGPPEQTVRVELERDGALARLSVADEGPGVPRADRARAFAPFVRLTHAGGTAGGSGIGLSVVRSLVEQHGGEVGIEDAPGGGARVVVVLPLAAVGPSPLAAPAGVAAPPGAIDVGRGTPVARR
jgi:signal transduction histidine kinase